MTEESNSLSELVTELKFERMTREHRFPDDGDRSELATDDDQGSALETLVELVGELVENNKRLAYCAGMDISLIQRLAEHVERLELEIAELRGDG